MKKIVRWYALCCTLVIGCGFGLLLWFVILNSKKFEKFEFHYTLWIILIFFFLLILGLLFFKISQKFLQPLQTFTDGLHHLVSSHSPPSPSIRQVMTRDYWYKYWRLCLNRIQKMQDSERTLRSMLEGMVNGVLVTNAENVITFMNLSSERILGGTSHEWKGKEITTISLPSELVEMIQESKRQNLPVRREIMFYFPKEQAINVHVKPIFDTHQQFGGIILVLHDMTEIRKLERMRSEFVANVSHELKTPLASVKGFAETLLVSGLEDREIAKSFLQIIFDESDRLNRLIGDIMELSKIESGKVPMNFSPIELSSFLRKNIEIMITQAYQKNITLELITADNLWIEADEDRLHQIMINLLSNSIKYTPENGKVKVVAEILTEDQQQEQMRITVIDTGIGIPKKDLPRIFERFYRVDKARSRNSGGTGLGLSIVKHLVEQHKGNIRIESKEDFGTRIIIELPVVHDER